MFFTVVLRGPEDPKVGYFSVKYCSSSVALVLGGGGAYVRSNRQGIGA